MDVFFNKIFNPKPKEVIDNSKSAVEARALSDEIGEIRKLILESHSEDVFKEACKNCLVTWEDQGKFRLADLALELNQNSYPTLADHVWDVLDKHFSKTGYFYKQYYLDPQGLKELADQPDCGLAAYLYGIRLYLGDGIPKDKPQGYHYLKKSTECGSQLAFQFFQNKQSVTNVPSATSSPLHPKYKNMVEAGTYIKNAQQYFNIGLSAEAERELQRAASIKEESIVVMGDKFKANKNYETALLCFEIAALSGDKEAIFKSMKIKADQGNADQQYRLALAYFSGGEGNEHPAKDVKEGSKYANKALDQGHVGATFMAAELHLNWYYYRRDGGPNREKMSIAPPECFTKSSDPGSSIVKYLSKAAKAGHATALQIIQTFDEIGADPNKICIVFGAECGDRAAQFEIQKIKADKGDAQAILAVGVLYRDGGPNGKNPEKNVPRAINYFKGAIDKGNQEAQLALSLLEQQLAAQELRSEETSSSSADQELDHQEMAQKREQENSYELAPPLTSPAQQADEPEATHAESQKDTTPDQLKQTDEEISMSSEALNIGPQVTEQETSSEFATTLAYFIEQAKDVESMQLATEDQPQTDVDSLKPNGEKENSGASEKISSPIAAQILDQQEMAQKTVDASSESLPANGYSSEPITIAINHVDAALKERKNSGFTVAPKLDNLFLENLVPIPQAEVKSVVQPNDNTDLPTTLSASSRQITIAKEEAAGKVSEESGTTSGSSTTFIFICLLFAVPLTAVMAHQYYKKRTEG